MSGSTATFSPLAPLEYDKNYIATLTQGITRITSYNVCYTKLLRYYAGPAKTPKGMPSGSFGPTTAGRMDSYVDLFQSHGGSLVMIAKGNRSREVTDACRKHGGFYLGSIGGPAALLAQENIRKVEVLEYPELGMEAIYRITSYNVCYTKLLRNTTTAPGASQSPSSSRASVCSPKPLP